MSSFVPGLEVAQVKRVRKLRELPISGEILVKLGEVVRADQSVARAELPGELQILRVPEQLSIEASEALEGIRRQSLKEGDQLLAGQLLCEHAGLFGLFRSRFHSPVSGRIEFISETNGHIGVRLPSRILTRDAFISGEVVAVESGRSVTIETQAAFIQGIFGVGGERRGVIRVLDLGRDQPLRAAHLNGIELRGAILVGGIQPEIEFLRGAAEAGVSGLVTGSIDDRALREYLGYDLGVALTGDEELSMSVIITEGFGRIAISERILEIARKFAGSLASMNGATQVRAGAIRPELIIPHNQEVNLAASVGVHSLEVGALVRIIRVPYFGQSATVVQLPSEPAVIETGARCRVLRARLEDGREVIVPRANVELI